MEPQFRIEVQDPDTRKHAIKTRCDASTEVRPFYAYLPRDLSLKVITLPIGLPIYRMANARTRPAQIRYLHDNNITDKDFFRTSEEDVAAQRIQHGILLEFAHQTVGSDPNTDIWTVLEKESRQTEELIVTAEGVVVNGNRRLAAMRELYKQGNEKFAEVRVQVLDATLTPTDIKKIEVRLQVTPETILPYEWTAEALLIRDLRADKIDDLEIMRLMRKNKKSDIDDLVGRLNEAEIYLTECLKEPDNYGAVDGQQQQFIELQKALKNKKPSEADAARKIAFAITRHGDDLAESRLYDYRVAYGTNMTTLLTEFATRAGIVLDDARAKEEDDIFSGGAPADPIGRYKPVIDRIAKYTEEDANLIFDITEDIIEANKNKNSGDRPLRQLQRATKILESLRVENARDEIRGEMRKQFEKLRAAVGDLGKRLA